MTDADAVSDRTGHPIRPRAYVRVERDSPAFGLIRFRGVVQAVEADRVGPVVRIDEWRDGRRTGKTRICRPGDCLVARKPASVVEHQDRVDRIGRRAAALDEQHEALKRGRAKQRAKRQRGRGSR